jgi:hypothetical protein
MPVSAQDFDNWLIRSSAKHGFQLIGMGVKPVEGNNWAIRPNDLAPGQEKQWLGNNQTTEQQARGHKLRLNRPVTMLKL